MSINTERSEAALRHLKQLKPYDGWSLDNYTNMEGQTKVMLKRRNVPLYKKGFDCIAYDDQDSMCVIGITSSIGDTDNNSFCRGVVLVDRNGAVVRDEKVVRIRLKKDQVDETKKEREYKDMMDSKVKNLNYARDAQQRQQRQQQQQHRSRQQYQTQNNNTNQSPVFPNLTDEQTSEMAKLGLMAIGVLTVLRIFAKLFSSVFILVLPLLGFYAISECPSIDSFDAKKEIKRVLRGHHLPDNHPDKPKTDDWLSSTIARVTASVATEVATSFGYELSFMNCYGICHIATVYVPVIDQELYWIGIFGTWRYLFKREKGKAKQE